MKPDTSMVTPSLSPDATEDRDLRPPQARRESVEHLLHGDLRVDDYAWLRQKENPKVVRHLEAENAYSDAFLKPTEPFQEELYQEMLGRILQADLSVPYRLRGYLNFTRTEDGKQYPIHCRRPDVEGSAELRLLARNCPGLRFFAYATGNSRVIEARSR